MAPLNEEHRKWVDTFLKHTTGNAPLTGDPGVLMAGPNEPGFGNNPHPVDLNNPRQPGFGNNPRAIDPTKKDPKQPLPDKPGQVATSEGYLVASVPPTTDANKSFNDFTTKAVKFDKEAVALRAKLDALDKQEKQVRDFVQTNSKNLETEVGNNQSDSIKNVARDMGQERRHFELVSTVLSSLKLTIEDAKLRLDSAQLKLDSIKNLDEARRLSEKVQEQSKKMDGALSLIGNAIQVGVAIFKGDPTAIIKPIYDATTTILKLKTENPLAKEAAQLRRTGTSQAVEAAYIDIDAALTLIDKAGTIAETAGKQQIEGFENYVEMRGDVERLYDGSTKGKFKFGDLAKHLVWLDSSAALGLQTFEVYEKAYFYADGLRDIYRAVMDQMKPQDAAFMEAQLVLKDLASAHAKGKSAARTKMQQFAALRGSLELMRDNATQKLAHAPAPAPGKK